MQAQQTINLETAIRYCSFRATVFGMKTRQLLPHFDYTLYMFFNQSAAEPYAYRGRQGEKNAQ